MLHTKNGAGWAAQSHQLAMDPTTDTMASDGAVTAVRHPRRDLAYSLCHGFGPDDHQVTLELTRHHSGYKEVRASCIDEAAVRSYLVP
jgi:hypothetical protein